MYRLLVKDNTVQMKILNTLSYKLTVQKGEIFANAIPGYSEVQRWRISSKVVFVGRSFEGNWTHTFNGLHN